MANLTNFAFAISLLVGALAGLVKGVTGFAMPLIMISALSSFLTPDLALAGLILQTLVTNFSQAFRQGLWPALETARFFWRFLTAVLVMIMISAQFVRVIPQGLFFLLLGLPTSIYALVLLLGKSLALPLRHRGRVEWALGVVAGFYGGLAGVWGPPLLVYLFSINADKKTVTRVQGVMFLLGAFALLGAHLYSGILNLVTVPFSAALCVPALAGMALGFRLQDCLSELTFNRLVQAMLLVAGLNLMRRALEGFF